VDKRWKKILLKKLDLKKKNTIEDNFWKLSHNRVPGYKSVSKVKRLHSATNFGKKKLGSKLVTERFRLTAGLLESGFFISKVGVI